MNGAWMTPEWEAAQMALQKLQNENKGKLSVSDDKSTVKSTSAAGALTTSAPSTMSYDASFYSQYYAAYQHPYAAYGMYGYGPYSQYPYMPFMPTPQQMQPPPPPPPSAKNEPKSESPSEPSPAVSTTAVSVSGADATSLNSDSTVKAEKETTLSTSSTAQNTWPKASSADAASAGPCYPNNAWQPSVASSAAGMSPQFQNAPRPRLKSYGPAGFQNAYSAASVGGGSWQRPAMTAGDAGRFSAGAGRLPRPPASSSSAMPSLRWSNSPRVNPYDGTFRQAGPRPSSEPYCPFDPTESEECEDQAANSKHFGGFSPAPDAGNFRFRMPGRGVCRPMQWRQQAPRPRFNSEMHSPPRGPAQQSPDWRFGQYSARQQVLHPDPGNAGARPVIMHRVKNYTPRARAPWSASPVAQKMPDRMSKPSEWQESRWDKDETVSSAADAAKSSATRPSSESAALSPASADDWPTPLKNYVHRCFGSVKDTQSKDMMEIKLKEMLTAAFQDGTALTRDWDREAVPDILNSSTSFQSLASPSAADSYGRSPSNLRSPRNLKFAGSPRGQRGTASSGSRRGRGWSPPGFRRRSRSRSHSRKSRSRSSSRSSSSSRHSSRSRRRRHRRRRNSRYCDVAELLVLTVIY